MLQNYYFYTKLFKNILARPGSFIMVENTVRKVTTLEVTKNISILTKNKNAQIIDFRVQNEQNKPLVVILSWLLAKQKHIMKYADFYMAQGFDVMNINITPWQLLWPLKGTQVVAADIVKFLDANNAFSPLLLHGFSVGGYLWSEVLVILANEQDKYQHVISRVVGQVWDSLADITEIPYGFPFAVFPNNYFLQSTLQQYILYHMKTFDKVATCHYVRGSQMFHTNIIRAPALFFVSQSDPVGSEKSNLRVKENWESIGISVTWKCWEKSPHVGHFQKYPEEYLEELQKFLQVLGVSSKSETVASQVKAKF